MFGPMSLSVPRWVRLPLPVVCSISMQYVLVSSMSSAVCCGQMPGVVTTGDVDHCMSCSVFASVLIAAFTSMLDLLGCTRCIAIACAYVCNGCKCAGSNVCRASRQQQLLHVRNGVLSHVAASVGALRCLQSGGRSRQCGVACKGVEAARPQSLTSQMHKPFFSG